MKTADHFLYGSPTEEQRKFLENVFELGFEFIDGTARNGQVLQYADNEDLKELFSEPLPRQGADLDDLFSTLRDKVAAYSIAQSDPRYLSFPDTGNSIATIAADILGSFLNQNLIAVDRSAPSGTFVEMQLLLWLRELIGYSSFPLTASFSLQNVGGMWTSGGNMSNHIAVLIALYHRFPQVKKSGLVSLRRRPVIVMSKGIEHFSFAGAALTLGLGADGILWADADSDFTTNVDSIEAALKNCPDDAEPFMVVCVAGNCRTTSIDNIVRMRKICDANNLWLHVDACHGGSLLFSEKLRERLHGIELADSVSLDPHKGIFVTYPSSYVLFRDPATLATMCRYPDRVADPECLDLGLITPFFGSRGFQSLKLWLLIKHLGVEGLGQAIESRQEVNLRLTSLLDQTGLFTFFNKNDFYRLAFVFCPESVRGQVQGLINHQENGPALLQMINRYTEEFCTTLYKSGGLIFDLFSLQDLDNRVGLGLNKKYSVMAMAIGHPIMKQCIEDEIIRSILNVGLRLQARMLKEIGENFGQAQEDQTVMYSGPAGW